MRMSVVTSLDDKHMIAKATKKRKVLQDRDHLRRIVSDMRNERTTTEPMHMADCTLSQAALIL
jgi:hypothetical protein